MTRSGPVDSPARTTTSLPVLPEALLAPLTDSAAEVLRALEPQDVPVALRPLAGFDRRGLSRSAARQQLLRALEIEDGFREQTVARFCARPEVEVALESWKSEDAFGLVEEAAERADLALLASTLFAARPRGWAFGLGVACAFFGRQRVEQQEDAALKARDLQIGALEESKRRAEAAREKAQSDAVRLEQQLRDERQGRRAREAQATRDVEEARHRTGEAERVLAKARATADAAEARLRREAERARVAEREMRELKRQLAEVSVRPDVPESSVVLRREDLRVLVDAADLARRLSDGLGGVAERARERLPSAARATPEAKPAPAPRPPADRRPGRRVQPQVPPGMVEDEPAALDAMLRTDGVVLVVDGYNVSMLAWGDASPAEQRDRLLAAIAELQSRTRANAIVVFDGADVEGVRPPRTPGVRVMFSPADEEADAVVVEQVASLPEHVPVVVASSDGWVRNHALQQGARVVSSQTLLSVLRR